MHHPLDPLSAAEIEAAVLHFRAGHSDPQAFFCSIERLEPAKHLLKKHEQCPRSVKLMGVDSQPDGGFEATIDLTEGALKSVNRLALGAQAAYGIVDLGLAIQLTKSNQEWLDRVAARGIATATKADLELIQVDPWPAGGYAHPDIPDGHRAIRCIAFLKEDATDNGYARPIHGLIAHLDLTAGKVVHVEDSGVIPIPPSSGRFDSAHQEKTRTDLKQLDITQPEGASFTTEGYRVKWQGYDLRVSIHPVHGLVLHQMSLKGRPVLYRAALSEMIVPYGDADNMHSWKHVLDASEYNMGTLVNSLKLGCDCLGEIHYFDIHQVTWDGKAKTVENAICMHEEDYGIQWKHYDLLTQVSEVRRSRRLVISSIFTVGNYDYGFYWYLYLDGTIQMEIKLTGIVGVSAVTPETHNAAQAPMIADSLASPVHQHLFCFRLDWELDGGNNSLYENEIEVMPLGENNPDGTQFCSVSRHLADEHSAKRNIAPQISRHWKVTNPEKLNGLGVPVAYKLLPAASPSLHARPESQVGRRGAFGLHHLWATPYAEEEQGAAGQHTVMHHGEGGLPELTRNNRDISHCDLVMWHTVALTHVPRPEDWPVMPVEYTGFHLIPVGFFDRNPTLDLPTQCHSAKQESGISES
ncbi:MAG: primary-amine oxidase [Pseudomonadales bacterium]|nr:primary-amine oxidase [Pseudomonadales bacterium]